MTLLFSLARNVVDIQNLVGTQAFLVDNGHKLPVVLTHVRTVSETTDAFVLEGHFRTIQRNENPNQQ